MASPGNQHCANCIGTLSFSIALPQILLRAAGVGYLPHGASPKFSYTKIGFA